MSAPFQVGDAVVCVDDSACRCCGMDLPARKGRYYHVEATQRGFNNILNEYITSLVLRGVPTTGLGRHSGWGLNAARFRKIDDEVTEEFREQLRSLNPPKPILNPSRHLSHEGVGR